MINLARFFLIRVPGKKLKVKHFLQKFSKVHELKALAREGAQGIMNVAWTAMQGKRYIIYAYIVVQDPFQANIDLTKGKIEDNISKLKAMEILSGTRDELVVPGC